MIIWWYWQCMRVRAFFIHTHVYKICTHTHEICVRILNADIQTDRKLEKINFQLHFLLNHDQLIYYLHWYYHFYLTLISRFFYLNFTTISILKNIYIFLLDIYFFRALKLIMHLNFPGIWEGVPIRHGGEGPNTSFDSILKLRLVFIASFYVVILLYTC